MKFQFTSHSLLHFIFLTAVALLIFFHHTNAGEIPDSSTVVATWISQPVKIDGWLSEPVWQQALPIRNFRQREPKEGLPATEKTEVRILFDKENLYFGILCFDNHPESITAKEMETDGQLGLDDNFTLLLDTYHDYRNGFYFQVNPNGAKFDAQVQNSGESLNMNWNGIWDVKTRITAQGWTAEIILPFKTLRFTGDSLQVWGINLRRYIARKNEQDLWQAWHRNQGIRQLSGAGVLKILQPVLRGKHLELKPYLSTGLEHGYTAPGYQNDQRFKSGLDTKYGLTSTLTLDFTVNTDFAQVEADRARINLTRFSLFYPEKRDFFLESSDNFSFGSSHRAMAFYSRRIGLSEEGEQIPILAGGRITGKVGQNSLGVLNIQTRRQGDIPSTNFSVLRLKHDVFRQSYLGMIFTNKTPGDTTSSNRVAGVDATLSTSHFLGEQNLIFHTYYMESFSNRRVPQNHSFRVFFDYPNDLFDNFIQYFEVGKNFAPEIGFVRRSDIRSVYGHAKFMPRFHHFNVRRLVFKIQGSYTTDFENVLKTRFFEYRPFGFDLHSGEDFEFNIQTDYERLDEPFDIFDDYSIPVGIYNMLRWEIQFSTKSSRPLSSEIFLNWGEFYTGRSTELNLQSRIRVNKYLTVVSDYQRTAFRLSDQRFTTHEASLRLNVNLTTHLTSRLFMQWNNEDEELNFNFRLRWIPRLGSDFYLVYNELQDTRIPGFRSNNRVLLLKFAYWWGI